MCACKCVTATAVVLDIVGEDVFVVLVLRVIGSGKDRLRERFSMSLH